MKTTKLFLMGIALISAASFTSCKKDYTCTCTTVVGGVSADVKHDINDATYVDAKKSCKNYEDEGNNSLPGSTDCHL